MHRRIFIFALFAALVATSAPAASFEDLVRSPDPRSGWRVVRTESHPQGLFALLELTSQVWRTEAEIDRPLWLHRLEVYLPARTDHDTALLAIGGGLRSDPGPKGADGGLGGMAVDLHAVVARLSDVPNQPLVFRDDPEAKPRREDQILSRAWARDLATGDPGWLAQLAMARSAVRAMDAVSAFCASGTPQRVEVRRFVVTGASKRGWTSWLAAAADPRVAGVAPKVIDLLNLEPSMHHHRAAYGRYADAVQDYVREGIMDHLGTPGANASLALIDPWAHRERLTMPKLIVNSTGDQFFLPDSWRFYWNDLPGPKYLRYIPNTDHGLDRRADATVRSFFACLLKGCPLPAYTWRETAPGRIRVETPESPMFVLTWRATNPSARDFMLKTIGPSWASAKLAPSTPGVYEASADAPKRGWTALLVELHFRDPAGGREPLVLTSGVTVTPAALPFPEPADGGVSAPSKPQ